MKKFWMLAAVVCMSTSIVGCASKKDQAPEVTNQISETPQVQEEDYKERMALLDLDDEWVYELSQVEKKNGEKTEISYHFDCVNMKHKTIDNCYMPVIDSETGNILEDKSVLPDIPSYLYMVGAERDDVKQIEAYLNKQQFQRQIEETDLNDLELKYVNKKNLVDLYNKCLQTEYVYATSEIMENLKLYMNIPGEDCIEKQINSNEALTLSYMTGYGTGIERIHIDISYKDGMILSDKVKENKANKKQKEEYKKIQRLEQFIRKNKTFDCTKYQSDQDDAYIQKALEIMNDLEEKNKL